MAKAKSAHARAGRFNPVPHTAEDTARLLADPEAKAAYEALEDEYVALRAGLLARHDAGLAGARCRVDGRGNICGGSTCARRIDRGIG
jgi:hypothetical protein